MKICEDGHDEIVFDGFKKCPLCTAKEEAQEAKDDLDTANDKIDLLEEKITSLKEQLEEAKGE